MGLKENYASIIAELKTKSKATGDKIKEATTTLVAEKAVYDAEIRNLEAGLKRLENPSAPVKKTRAKRTPKP